MRKSIKKIVATAAACSLAFVMAAGLVPQNASASVQCSKKGEKAGKAEINLDGTYNAYVGFQESTNWSFRDAWYNPKTGKNGTGYEKGADYSMFLTDGGKQICDGVTPHDVEIKGNGTYTVSIDNINNCMDQNATISMIYVSTDIPASAVKDGKIKISDISLSMDGMQKWAGEPYINADADEWGLYQFDIVNTYQQDGYESPTIQIPTDKMEITFTVSGFNSDNPDAVANTDEDATSGSDAASSEATEEKGSSPVLPIVIVVAVVVVVGAVVVIKKKKN